MKSLKEFIGFVVCVGVIWHIYVGFSSNTRIVGLFKQSPNLGYVWSKDSNSSSHFFWENTGVYWLSGIKHPNYNVISSNTEGRWTPIEGYKFTGDGVKDLTTVWQENVKHSTMNAYSSADEGYWYPALGYKFILDQDGRFSNTTWNAGVKYEELKIIASDRVGYFEAFPGYKFKDPTKGIDVVWTPGLIDPLNSESMAGQTEGEWVSIYETTDEVSPGNQVGTGIGIAITANIFESIFGKSAYTDAMKEEGAKQVVMGGIRALQ